MKLKKHLIDPASGHRGYFPIDLSIDNPYWDHNDVSEIEVFELYLDQQRKDTDKYVAYGGYLEQRALYRNSDRFQKGVVRDIHLGIDLWAPTGTSVHAIMDGTIHSFANNNDHGNYGPTVILEHDWNGSKIYSLYGHLSLDSMDGWEVGLRFRESEIIATLGAPHENVGYAPHLHFQVMNSMQDYHGDFPGVAAKSELDHYQKIVLDPNPFIFEL